MPGTLVDIPLHPCLFFFCGRQEELRGKGLEEFNVKQKAETREKRQFGLDK